MRNKDINFILEYVKEALSQYRYKALSDYNIRYWLQALLDEIEFLRDEVNVPFGLQVAHLCEKRVWRIYSASACYYCKGSREDTPHLYAPTRQELYDILQKIGWKYQ